MTEEKYKQSRKPLNPLEGVNIPDAQAVIQRIQDMEKTNSGDPTAEAVMQRVRELGKNVPAVDPMTRYASSGTDTPLPFAVEGKMPPDIAQMFKKDSQATAQRQTQEAQIQSTSQGPRLGYTNNPKLNELIEGVKASTANYEEIRLPSLSKFYDDSIAPEGGVIHVRPMTGQEEEILSTQRLLKKGHAINMIFNNCCRERINPVKLLTIDRTYLLIYLRGISIGPIYSVELRCPLCANRFDSHIDLDQLPVSSCPPDFSVDNLKGVLPITKYKFSFRLPTVNDETMINNYSDKRSKQAADSNATDDTFVWRTALLLEEIEGLNEHSALMTLIERLPIADVSHLRHIMSDIPFGVETKITQWCPSCNEDFEIELPIEAGFFFPQPKKVKRTRVTN